MRRMFDVNVFDGIPKMDFLLHVYSQCKEHSCWVLGKLRIQEFVRMMGRTNHEFESVTSVTHDLTKFGDQLLF